MLFYGTSNTFNICIISGMPDFSPEVGSNIFLSCVRCENVTTIDHNSLDCFKVEQNSRKRKKKVSSCKLESTTLVSLPFCCSLSSIQCSQLIIISSEISCVFEMPHFCMFLVRSQNHPKFLILDKVGNTASMSSFKDCNFYLLLRSEPVDKLQSYFFPKCNSRMLNMELCIGSALAARTKRCQGKFNNLKHFSNSKKSQF